NPRKPFGNTHHQEQSGSGDPPRHRHQTYQRQARRLLRGGVDLAGVWLGHEPALPHPGGSRGPEIERPGLRRLDRRRYGRRDHAQHALFRDLKESRREYARPEPCTVEGEALKKPQIYTSNLLIEVYFKTAPGHTLGVLMEKMKGKGYSLTIGASGKLCFDIRGSGASATAESKVKVNDGRWHHATVEADRRARTLT